MLRRHTRLALCLALFSFIGGLLPANAAVFTAAKQRPLYVPGRLVVKYKPGADPTQHLAALKALAAEGEKSLAGIPRLNVVTLPKGADVMAAVRQLEASGLVEYVEPDYYRYPTTNPIFSVDTFGLPSCTHTDYATLASNPAHCVYPNDPAVALTSAGGEWYLENHTTKYLHADIGLTAAWGLMCDPNVGGVCQGSPAEPATSRDFIVAIIDDGFDLQMSEIKPNFIPGTDCSGGTCTATSPTAAQATATDGTQDHGTYVASTMAAVGGNGTAIAGVTWDAKILPIKTDLTSSAIVAGIEYAVGKHARIINESFGGAVPSQAEYDALTDAQKADILVVVSAGNSDSDNDRAGAFFPANYGQATVIFPRHDGAGDPIPGTVTTKPGLPNVIAVDASDNSDSLTSWSQWGSFGVALLAPGEGIIALQRGTDNGLANVAGTSFSSPITAGSAALVGEYRTEVKSETPDWHDLKAHLLNGSEPSQPSVSSIDGRSATGRLNTYLAMQDVSHGVIVVQGASIDDSVSGNNDGEIDPGETANIVVTVANIGPDETDVQGTLSYAGSLVTIPAGTATQDAGAITSTGTTPNVVDGAMTMSFPVTFNSIQGNQSLLFRLDITTASGGSETRYFYLEAGTLVNGVTLNGTLTRNPYDDFQDYHIDVPNGGKNLVFYSTTPGGVDIDLIAMQGRLPQYLETLGVDNPSTDPEFQQYIEPNAQISGRADGDESIAYDGLKSVFDAANRPVTSAGTYHIVVVNFTGRSKQPYTLTACYAPPGSDEISFDGNYEYDEAAGTATLTLLRSGNTGAVSVKYATKDGGLSSSNHSAKAGTNYSASGGTVSWASGDSTPKTFSVPIINTGAIAKGSVSFLHFRAALSSPGGGVSLGCIQTTDVAIGNPATVIPSSGGGSGGGGGGTTTPTTGGKSGGGVFDLLSLLALGLAFSRRRRN